MSWFVVAMLALGTAGQRLAGMFLAGPVLARHRVLERLGDLLPAAVVAAVVAQLTLASGRSLVLDVRVAALAVAAVLVWRRAPFVVVVAGAAVTAAGLRLVT